MRQLIRDQQGIQRSVQPRLELGGGQRFGWRDHGRRTSNGVSSGSGFTRAAKRLSQHDGIRVADLRDQRVLRGQMRLARTPVRILNLRDSHGITNREHPEPGAGVNSWLWQRRRPDAGVWHGRRGQATSDRAAWVCSGRQCTWNCCRAACGLTGVR